VTNSTVSAEQAPPAEQSPPASDAPYTGLRRLGSALTYRDFRVLWIGAFTSSIGTWMQKVAQNWLVLTLATSATSAFYLGLDAFLAELPILLFMLVGGVIADMHDRRLMLLTSQTVQMLSALVLAVLVFTDRVTMWHVLVLSTVTGVGQAFGAPAYQSLIPSLVGEKRHLPNAIALNSIQFNLARVIGPLVAGATLAAFGMAICFGLNALSFLAVITALLLLRARHVPAAAGRRMRAEFVQGLDFVRGHKELITLTVLGFATTFLANPLLTFLPLFTQNVFGGDVGQYTRLMAFAGGGAVTGALVVAWLGKFRHMGRTLLLMQLALGTVVVLFALTRVFWMNALLLYAGGISLVMTFALLSSLVQLLTPDAMRGRVMSFYLLAFRGGMPLGALVAGWVATRTSAPGVLLVNGLLLVAVAGSFLVSSRKLAEV